MPFCRGHLSGADQTNPFLTIGVRNDDEPLSIRVSRRQKPVLFRGVIRIVVPLRTAGFTEIRSCQFIRALYLADDVLYPLDKRSNDWALSRARVFCGRRLQRLRLAALLGGLCLG